MMKFGMQQSQENLKTFRFTAENAKRHGIDRVTPWIALAAGYRRQTDKFHAWSGDWNYDLIYSWKLGREINNSWYSEKIRTGRFAPWDKAKVVVFYPAPFNRDSPHWGQQFVAYVSGANGYKLPEGIGLDLRKDNKLEEKAENPTR